MATIRDGHDPYGTEVEKNRANAENRESRASAESRESRENRDGLRIHTQGVLDRLNAGTPVTKADLDKIMVAAK